MDVCLRMYNTDRESLNQNKIEENSKKLLGATLL